MSKLTSLLTRGRVIGGLAAVVVGGALLAGTALAQTPAPTATPAPNKPVNQIFQSFISSLAQKLGKTEAEVQTAIGQAQIDAVNNAAQQGKIPAQAADQLRSRLQQGPLPFSPLPHGDGAREGRFGHRGRGPMGPGPMGGWFGMGHQQELSAVATFLGVTPEQLKSEIQSGKSLAEIAQAHGKSRDDLKAAIVTSVQSQLSQAVTNGHLTQQQADNMLNKVKSNVDTLIDAKPGQRKFERGPKPSASPQPTAKPQA